MTPLQLAPQLMEQQENKLGRARSAVGCVLIYCSFIAILLLHDVTTFAHGSRIVLSITQATTLHTSREIVGWPDVHNGSYVITSRAAGIDCTATDPRMDQCIVGLIYADRQNNAVTDGLPCSGSSAAA